MGSYGLPIREVWKVLHRIEVKSLLASAQARSYSAFYRSHHVALLSRIMSVLCPALLPPHQATGTKFQSRSVPELLASRTFSHSYRERQLAHLKAYLPSNSLRLGSRRISSVPLLTHLTESDGATKMRSRRAWLLRGLGASFTVYLCLRLLSREEAAENVGLNDKTYVPFTITDKEQVSPTASIFTLSNKAGTIADVSTPVQSISIKEPNANVQRPYTILSADGLSIKILVRRYEGGELSRYIHSRKTGSELFIRKAPSVYVLPDTLPESYLLIVGGTGIAVAHQLVKHLTTLPDAIIPRVAIMHASLSPEERYLGREFVALQERLRGKLQIKNYIDSDQTFISAKDIQREHTNSATTLVCGSDGFVAHIAGPKPEQVQEGQGPIGGLLRVAGIVSNVYKL